MVEFLHASIAITTVLGSDGDVGQAYIALVGVVFEIEGS
jgi:hypothetical protein